MLARPTPEQVVIVVLRVAWLGLLFVGGNAIDGAVADAPAAVAAVATWGAFALWAVTTVALAVPSVVGLTVVRVLVPLSVPSTVVAWAAGAEARWGAAATALAAVVAVVAGSAELGRTFVQASAYGDEQRHPLRPPAAYLLAAGLTWTAWAAATIAGPLLLADRRWIAGPVVTAAAIALSAWAWPRWHRLSRRWLVFVPAGLVVHDHVALAETLMLRRNEVAALRLAPADTEALDLTGPAGGHAVEISTREPATALVGATGGAAPGSAVHLTACLVAPTRPGRALSEARRRRLPVG